MTFRIFRSRGPVLLCLIGIYYHRFLIFLFSVGEKLMYHFFIIATQLINPQFAYVNFLMLLICLILELANKGNDEKHHSTHYCALNMKTTNCFCLLFSTICKSIVVFISCEFPRKMVILD